MEKRFSSHIVPLYKLIFVFVAVMSVLDLLRDWKNVNVPGLLFVTAWCAFWYFGVNPWKSVRLKDGTLFISDYLKVIEVPVDEIASVEGSSFWGWQPQTVKLKLKSRTIFGDEIVFVPNGGWINARSYADDLRRELDLQ